jgi:RimJ/RimL family protein N-acetyltransferase
MTKIIEFNTARLLLRQWKASDRAPFAALNADSRVMEFFPNLLDRLASDEMADRIQSQIAERGWGFWAVEAPGESSFIGFVGLSIPAYEIPASPCVEIGWRLARKYWGKGYATEAAGAVLRIGFKTLHLPEIVSFTALSNHSSRAVMERISMQKTDENFEHPCVPEGHPLRLHVLYRLSYKQWSNQFA